MTDADLYAEITSGPLADTLAAAWKLGDDTGVAAALNAPDPARAYRRQPVARRDIKQAVLGKLGAILTSTSPAAAPLKLLFADPDFPTIDTDSPLWLGLVQGLVAANLLTADDAAAVSALADVAPASRAQQLWGAAARVTPTDVGRARKAGAG